MIWENLSNSWRICLHEAWEAYCSGSAPIGAVITDRNDNVLSRGRNSISTPISNGNHLAGTRVAHAEMNALAGLNPEIEAKKCILYTTTEPCPMCIGAIRMCQIGELHYASKDNVAGSIELLNTTPFMRRKPVAVIELQDEDLEVLLVAMNVEFRLQTKKAEQHWVIDAWNDMCTNGVQFGYRLFESGQLRVMRDQQVGMGTVLSTLEILFREI